ncbi:unnamed protein product, partial [Discosporangium mesarthrocarpum]
GSGSRAALSSRSRSGASSTRSSRSAGSTFSIRSQGSRAGRTPRGVGASGGYGGGYRGSYARYDSYNSSFGSYGGSGGGSRLGGAGRMGAAIDDGSSSEDSIGDSLLTVGSIPSAQRRSVRPLRATQSVNDRGSGAVADSPGTLPVHVQGGGAAGPPPSVSSAVTRSGGGGASDCDSSDSPLDFSRYAFSDSPVDLRVGMGSGDSCGGSGGGGSGARAGVEVGFGGLRGMPSSTLAASVRLARARECGAKGVLLNNRGGRGGRGATPRSDELSSFSDTTNDEVIGGGGAGAGAGAGVAAEGTTTEHPEDTVGLEEMGNISGEANRPAGGSGGTGMERPGGSEDGGGAGTGREPRPLLGKVRERQRRRKALAIRRSQLKAAGFKSQNGGGILRSRGDRDEAG